MNNIRRSSAKKRTITYDIKAGVGLLAICGGYQLLGKKFVTGRGQIVRGIGLFDITTKAPSNNVKTRCIGNLVEECLIPELNQINLVGFENHSGQTSFTNRSKCLPLAKVIAGYGNNLESKYEGCVYKNAVGTYLHGSCLPKNPELTLWFIRNQLLRKNLSTKRLGELNLEISRKTNKQLVNRFK
ncbi:MAG: hypothetical protein HC932_05185 [Thermales bacterium]|nr:hypothetical protein [Thermales bacterium]